MRKQPYPVTQLTGGLDVSIDATFLVDTNSPNLRNFWFDKGLVKKGLGWTQFGTQVLDGYPMYMDTFPLQTGTLYYLFATLKWLYKYISVSKTFEKINRQVTTGAIDLTFVAATKKITRSTGSFTTDGFTSGTIITTDATLNPGPFTAVTVSALEIVVLETVVNEGPVSKTATGLVPLTGDEDNQFSSVVTLTNTGTDIFVLTNGKDKMLKWDGGSNFQLLSGWSTGPIIAKRLINFQSRLIGGPTIESGVVCPRRIRWSIAGNPEDITATGSGAVELAESADWVTALALLKSKLYIFKERSIWELVYVGSPDIFKPFLRIDGVGTFSPQSVINLGEELIFYGSDNIYLYDGIDLVPVGKNIYPYLYEAATKIVNSEKINRSPAAYIEELKSFNICLPTQGDIPNLFAEYGFDTKSWTLRDRQVTAFGYYTVAGQPRWCDLVGTWNDQTWQWMQKPLSAGAPTTLMGTPDGTIYEDNRLEKSTDTAFFESKDWIFTRAQRWTEIRVLAKGGPFTLSYSLDRGVSWSNPKTLPVSSEFTEYIVWVNKTSQQLRVKVNTTAQELEIKWIEPWYIPRQRSKKLVSN